MQKVDIDTEKMKREAIKETRSFVDEFKVFIKRGNVMDLAIGVVIGGAFSTIVTSLVNDIIMPLIGVIIGGHDFSNLTIVVGDATIKYGSFIQNVVNFILIAFCLFTIMRTINKTLIKEDKKKKEEEKKEDEQITLLKEIRDSLKEKSSK